MSHQKECLISSSGLNAAGAFVGFGEIVGDSIADDLFVDGQFVGDCYNDQL